ncbi:hypothetical protein [Devosia ginsengisoli]|uniref:hypothetical protein n=1 Tax=Devosia ginsengisoli TaxID=400770 RepID=UPI0026EFB636|nr:hypothetical protein [Devosia ginsengisoli]MCR6670583.1 hypothetical protein [Devosia ginsengisoli]
MMYYGPPLAIEHDEDASGLTRRIRNLIGTVALDCDCRQRVNDALQRFAAQEQHRHDRQCLMDARQQRASIAALVDLLGELEDVTWQEGDRSVFAELAHIFDDIARMAAQGSAAMQMISRETTP